MTHQKHTPVQNTTPHYIIWVYISNIKSIRFFSLFRCCGPLFNPLGLQRFNFSPGPGHRAYNKEVNTMQLLHGILSAFIIALVVAAIFAGIHTFLTYEKRG